MTSLRSSLQSLIIAIVLTSTRIVFGQVIDRGSFVQVKDGISGEQELTTSIDIGQGVKLPIHVDVTIRRNGVLKAANVNVKILDEYDDGSYYVGGMLHTEFIDVSGDGYKDLVLTGTIAKTGNKESDPVTYLTVTEIYVFDVKKQTFRLAFRTGPKLAE